MEIDLVIAAAPDELVVAAGAIEHRGVEHGNRSPPLQDVVFAITASVQ